MNQMSVVSPKGPVAGTVAVPDELKEALEDLQDTPQEAADAGFPPPTQTAKANAARLIRAMYGIQACRFEVYPTADGEVAIDAGVPNRSVILLCEAAGGALCLANTGATHRRAHYSDASQLPDGFLREALAELVDCEEHSDEDASRTSGSRTG